MSLDALRGTLRGPDGVRSRVAELQSRFGAKPADSGEFARTLAGKSPAPLAGPITFHEQGSDGLRPMNPLAQSMAPSIEGAQLRALADAVARREGVDPKLLAAVIETESGWDPLARSNKGAQGLAQLMPDTARILGVTSPLDPEQSLVGGARYLKQMLGTFHGDPRLAVAAYNAGPGAVSRAGGVPNYGETQRYVERVMARYGRG